MSRGRGRQTEKHRQTERQRQTNTDTHTHRDRGRKRGRKQRGGHEEREGAKGEVAGRDREKPLSSTNMSWGRGGKGVGPRQRRVSTAGQGGE